MAKTPYAEQLYLLARAAEADALRASHERFPELVKAHLADSMSYEFEASRYGDFLALFIGRGGEKLVTAVNLGITKEITLTEGTVPDMKGSVAYVVSLKGEGGDSAPLGGSALMQHYSPNCNSDDLKAPPKGYSYAVSAHLPLTMLQSKRKIILRLAENQTFAATWSDYTSSAYNSYYWRVKTDEVSRDAGDDIIEFRGAETRLCIPAGRGLEVRGSIYAALRQPGSKKSCLSG